MMSNSLKGALLSALVFPGVGQVVLKHHKRRIAFILTAVVILLVIVVKVLQNAFIILEKTKAEGGAISMNTITNTATQVSTSLESLTFMLLFLFIPIWIIGVVDAYRVGKRKDIEEGRAGGYESKV